MKGSLGMGQYYAPMIIDKPVAPTVRWWFAAHIYGNGLKLMEHSYVGNGLVRAVETFLRLDGGMRVVWAGDYADKEADGENLWQKTLTPSHDDHDYTRCVAITSALEPLYPGYESTLNAVVSSAHVVDVPLASDDECRYVLNLDTREYVDTTRTPLADPGSDWPARIHPLPLLTCEGNNRGGGDYRSNAAVIGSWARARVCISGHVPAEFTELDFAAVLPAEGEILV
ncbi:hypothetical protein CKJ66_28110 [Mycobacterium avium]|uniref:Uncharacterized protein n=1 Tax=Mycobacterium avium TaxID=1764 RepID=A0A2A2ZAQ6_MYCAV|nr:hypothetical protein [Mycobacterium avium]PBA23531.1 hypothetical protein CKJ66_28110 [Mycobacterium avium]